MKPLLVLNIQKGHFGFFQNVKNINMQKLKYCMLRKIFVPRVFVTVNLKAALHDGTSRGSFRLGPSTGIVCWTETAKNC